MAFRLTAARKWQLALSIFVVYWPLRWYINTSNPSWALHPTRLPFFVVEFLLTILFFITWISLSEWIQSQLFSRWFGENVVFEFKIPAQLATLVIASVMAVAFNQVFYFTWHQFDSVLETHLPQLRPEPRGQAAYRNRPPNAPNTPTQANINRKEQRRRGNNALTVMALLSAFYLTANRRAYQRLEQVEVRAERLEKENVQAQFAALKSQVNPHFLFNSLSILSSLVHTDADLSEQFIEQLSRAYRYILEQKDNDRVLLKTELEFIQAYRFLLNIRFDTKFDILIDVPAGEQQRYYIAPLTLQLLVENAVKHNRMSVREPLTVAIRQENDWLIVENNLQPRPQSQASTGVGLQNIMSRYSMLTERDVWVGESDGRFVVKIPLIPKERFDNPEL